MGRNTEPGIRTIRECLPKDNCDEREAGLIPGLRAFAARLNADYPELSYEAVRRILRLPPCEVPNSDEHDTQSSDLSE